MITKITNGIIISNGNIIKEKDLYFDREKILWITDEAKEYDVLVDAEGMYVSAGFIDTHIHGGGGYDFMDGGTDAIKKTANAHLKYGTTSILATTLSCSTEVLLEFLRDLREVMPECPTIVGAHLEGPYFSLSQCGAQNPDYILSPKPEEYEKIFEEGKGLIKKWSFAPELDGGKEFCKFLVKNNIIPSIGHSDALYEDVDAVYKEGCKLVTHFYSGMSGLTRKGGFRRLGVIESAYMYDDMAVEIIADGCHLPGELLKLIVKHKGVDNICLVTDSMRGAGMPEGESFLGRKGEETPCVIEEGVAKTVDRTGFAGSVATADRLVRTMVQKAGVPLVDAIKMLTVNPARILGLSDRGDILEGRKPDIVVFDDNINVKKVFLNGETIK